MEVLPGRSLARETRETFLLLAITASTLSGYVGLALFFVRSMT